MAQTTQQRDDWREKEFTIDRIFYFIAIAGALILFGVWLGTELFDADSVLPNVYTEALSIAVTVLILNKLAERREENALKRQLIMNAGSFSNEIAKDALHQIGRRGWLIGEDGILKGAHLLHANLRGANLRLANLQGADLIEVTLQGAYLEFANLRGAYLWQASLEGAKLTFANLQGAQFRGANLEGAHLGGAKLDSETTLPDGNKYVPNTGLEQLAKFIDGSWYRETGRRWSKEDE